MRYSMGHHVLIWYGDEVTRQGKGKNSTQKEEASRIMRMFAAYHLACLYAWEMYVSPG